MTSIWVVGTPATRYTHLWISRITADMASSDDTAQDMPLDAFIKEMAACGFEWVKRIGHVNVHIFGHTIARDVMPIPVERNVVRAVYVEYARKRCRELRGDPGSSV